MSDNEFDRDFETELRAKLRQSIIPPATPEYVRDAVEGLAALAAAESGGRRTFGTRPLHSFWLRGAAATAVIVAAIVALIAASVLWPSAQVATSGPTLTPGTILDLDVTADGGGFVYTEGDGLRVTADRGATWSEARQVPPGDSAQDHRARAHAFAT